MKRMILALIAVACCGSIMADCGDCGCKKVCPCNDKKEVVVVKKAKPCCTSMRCDGKNDCGCKCKKAPCCRKTCPCKKSCSCKKACPCKRDCGCKTTCPCNDKKEVINEEMPEPVSAY